MNFVGQVSHEFAIEQFELLNSRRSPYIHGRLQGPADTSLPPK